MPVIVNYQQALFRYFRSTKTNSSYIMWHYQG